jgi:hypothetical protein
MTLVLVGQRPTRCRSERPPPPIPPPRAGGDVSICGERNRGQDGNVAATKGRNPGVVLAGQGVTKLACGESHVRG